jgi:hypothetical protein
MVLSVRHRQELRMIENHSVIGSQLAGRPAGHPADRSVNRPAQRRLGAGRIAASLLALALVACGSGTSSAPASESSPAAAPSGACNAVGTWDLGGKQFTLVRGDGGQVTAVKPDDIEEIAVQVNNVSGDCHVVILEYGNIAPSGPERYERRRYELFERGGMVKGNVTACDFGGDLDALASGVCPGPERKGVIVGSVSR